MVCIMSCSLSVFFIENSLCHFIPESERFYHINLARQPRLLGRSLSGGVLCDLKAQHPSWPSCRLGRASLGHPEPQQTRPRLGEESPKSGIAVRTGTGWAEFPGL